MGTKAKALHAQADNLEANAKSNRPTLTRSDKAKMLKASKERRRMAEAQEAKDTVERVRAAVLRARQSTDSNN